MTWKGREINQEAVFGYRWWQKMMEKGRCSEGEIDKTLVDWIGGEKRSQGQSENPECSNGLMRQLSDG